MSLGCVAVISCSANAEIKVPQIQSIPQSVKNTNFVADKSIPTTADKISSAATANSSSGNEQNNFVSPVGNLNEVSNDTSQPKETNSQECVAQKSGNYMTLIPIGQFNLLNNPLYKLCLFANGESVGSYRTVSGRAHTQNKNRDRSGTEAPLPNGEYRVATKTTRATIAEAGDRFLPIYPQFQTGRTALGIHVDPSFDKSNGEDGTSGCIGLTSKNDLSKVLEYVRTFQPQSLEVKI
jgi:L,D-transpeptidase catalytic domain